jgi:hypothetical protein
VEFTLLRVAEELGFLKALEGASDTHDVIGEVLVVIQGVIEVVLKVLVEQRGKYLVHVVLETGRSIRKSESHYAESEGAEWSHEGGLPFISGSDMDLVVTRFQVELHEDFRSSDLVHHFVDVGKRIAILNCDVVELAIVDDQSVGSVLFPYEEHWCGNWAIRVGGFSPSGAQHLIEYLMAFGTFLLIHVVRSAGLREWFFGVQVDCEVGVRPLEFRQGQSGFLPVEHVEGVPVMFRNVLLE